MHGFAWNGARAQGAEHMPSGAAGVQPRESAERLQPARCMAQGGRCPKPPLQQGLLCSPQCVAKACWVARYTERVPLHLTISNTARSARVAPAGQSAAAHLAIRAWLPLPPVHRDRVAFLCTSTRLQGCKTLQGALSCPPSRAGAPAAISQQLRAA